MICPPSIDRGSLIAAVKVYRSVNDVLQKATFPVLSTSDAIAQILVRFDDLHTQQGHTSSVLCLVLTLCRTCTFCLLRALCFILAFRLVVTPGLILTL